MSRYWVSWWQPADGVRREAPGVIGEWRSGHRWSNYVDSREPVQEASMCALVTAENESHARIIIEAARVVIEWRFRRLVDDDWTPGDRFPPGATP